MRTAGAWFAVRYGKRVVLRVGGARIVSPKLYSAKSGKMNARQDKRRASHDTGRQPRRVNHAGLARSDDILLSVRQVYRAIRSRT